MRHTFETPWGTVGAEADESSITALYLPGCLPEAFSLTLTPSAILLEAERQIIQYFSGQRKEFTLPVAPAGTAFTKAVWEQLLKIPFGGLTTYGKIAKALGNPGAARAVGMACGKNPIPLLIPCHRVVGTGNKLIGFSGGGVRVKQRLIDLEAGGLFSVKMQ